jgi:hypothetical protein
VRGDEHTGIYAWGGAPTFYTIFYLLRNGWGTTSPQLVKTQGT